MESRVLRGSQTPYDFDVIPMVVQPLWLESFVPDAPRGITMSKLKTRMIRDMQLAGLCEGTRREYLRVVRVIGRFKTSHTWRLVLVVGSILLYSFPS